MYRILWCVESSNMVLLDGLGQETKHAHALSDAATSDSVCCNDFRDTPRTSTEPASCSNSQQLACDNHPAFCSRTLSVNTKKVQDQMKCKTSGSHQKSVSNRWAMHVVVGILLLLGATCLLLCFPVRIFFFLLFKFLYTFYIYIIHHISHTCVIRSNYFSFIYFLRCPSSLCSLLSGSRVSSFDQITCIPNTYAVFFFFLLVLSSTFLSYPPIFHSNYVYS